MLVVRFHYGHLSGKSSPPRLETRASSSRPWQDDAPHVAGTVITVTLLAYLTYGMRVYTRITRRSWGMEDWMMTLAAVSSDSPPSVTTVT